MLEQPGVNVVPSSDGAAIANNLGEKLRFARESKKISVSEVSQSLLISRKLIDALENNDYSAIVAPVYARGYLKSYAKFLQLPVDEVLNDFESMKVYYKDTKDLVLESDKEAVEIRRYMRWATFAIASILVVLVLIWAFGQHGSSKSVAEVATTNEFGQAATAAAPSEATTLGSAHEAKEQLRDSAAGGSISEQQAKAPSEKPSGKTVENNVAQSGKTNANEINLPISSSAQ